MPGMPGMEVYSKDDVSRMQDQMKPPDNEPAEPPKQEMPNFPQSTNLGLVETIKASFVGMVKSVKKLFGYGGNKNTEL